MGMPNKLIKQPFKIMKGNLKYLYKINKPNIKIL